MMNCNRFAVSTSFFLEGGGVILFSIADCYVFRHVFVTRLLEFGYDVHIIKKRIGRSNVKTTMIYTHVLNREGARCLKPYRSDVIRLYCI